MAYTAASLAAGTTPAKDFFNALDTLIRAAGFTFVETWTSSTDVTNVYKSPVASNGVVDWYFYLRRLNDTTTNVYFSCSEAWDTTGKKIQKYIPASGGTPNGSYQVNDSTGCAPNSGTNYSATVNTSTAGHQYWVSANTTRVVIGSRVGTTDTAVHMGLATEVIPSGVSGARAWSLYGGAITDQGTMTSTPNAAGGGLTTEPNQAGASSGNFGGPISSSYIFGFSCANNGVDQYSGHWYANPILIMGRNSTSPRGLLKDGIATGALGGTPVNGDTVTVGAKTYTRIQSGTNGSLWFDQGV